MSSVVQFPSGHRRNSAFVPAAITEANAGRDDQIGQIQLIVRDLERINAYAQFVIAQVTDEETRRQILTNAHIIDALIRVVRARVEHISQAFSA